MEVAIIIGLTIGSTTLIWNSEGFTHSQKVFLTVCFIFPPAQWVLAVVIYFFNKSSFEQKTQPLSQTKIDNQQDNSNLNSINQQKEQLELLRTKGILNEYEYEEKLNILRDKIILSKVYDSEEYQSLKKLYESELLSKEQFEDKSKKLIEDFKQKFTIVWSK